MRTTVYFSSGHLPGGKGTEREREREKERENTRVQQLKIYSRKS